MTSSLKKLQSTCSRLLRVNDQVFLTPVIHVGALYAFDVYFQRQKVGTVYTEGDGDSLMWRNSKSQKNYLDRPIHYLTYWEAIASLLPNTTNRKHIATNATTVGAVIDADRVKTSLVKLNRICKKAEKSHPTLSRILVEFDSSSKTLSFFAANVNVGGAGQDNCNLILHPARGHDNLPSFRITVLCFVLLALVKQSQGYDLSFYELNGDLHINLLGTGSDYCLQGGKTEDYPTTPTQESNGDRDDDRPLDHDQVSSWTLKGNFQVVVGDRAIKVDFTPGYIKNLLHHFEFMGKGISSTDYKSWFVPIAEAESGFDTPQHFAKQKIFELINQTGQSKPKNHPISDISNHDSNDDTTSKKTLPLPLTPVKLPNLDKLRKLASGMQKQVDAKLNPPIGNQRPTARRTRIASGIREEGRRLQQIQSWLYAIADATELGNLPSILSRCDNKKVLDLIYVISDADTGRDWRKDNDTWLRNTLWGNSGGRYQDYRDTLTKAGIKDYEETKLVIDALQSLSKSSRVNLLKDSSEYKIQKLEQDLIGCKIAGYFPTPDNLVNQMLNIADIKPGMTVLEPSAGKGSIADAIRDRSGIHPDVIECDYRLREILTLKKHNLIGDNFLEFEGQYDRIIQNPPWGKDFGTLHDADHVRHAYKCLKPGGKLVSIMSASFSFSQLKKGIEFREWLNSVGASWEQLPENSFKNSDRSTGVNAYLLVIEKSNHERELVTAGFSIQNSIVDDDVIDIAQTMREIEVINSEIKHYGDQINQSLVELGYVTQSEVDSWESPEPDWKEASRRSHQRQIDLMISEIQKIPMSDLSKWRSLLPDYEQSVDLKYLKHCWIEWVRQGNVDDHFNTSWERFASQFKTTLGSTRRLQELIGSYLSK